MADNIELDAKQVEAQKRQNLTDMANEHMGVETGRMARFLSIEAREQLDPRHREKRRDEQLSRLQRLLVQNAAYTALYNETWDQLNKAEQATELALEAARKSLTQAENELQNTMVTAATLSNGVRVFQDENGQVWSEHNVLVTGDALEEIVWPDDAPTYEDYTRQKETVQDLEKSISDLEIYQVDVLGHIRNRMTDENNPTDQGELKQFQKDIREKISAIEIETDIRDEIENTATPVTSITSPSL